MLPCGVDWLGVLVINTIGKWAGPDPDQLKAQLGTLDLFWVGRLQGLVQCDFLSGFCALESNSFGVLERWLRG